MKMYRKMNNSLKNSFMFSDSKVSIKCFTKIPKIKIIVSKNKLIKFDKRQVLLKMKGKMKNNRWHNN